MPVLTEFVENMLKAKPVEGERVVKTIDSWVVYSGYKDCAPGDGMRYVWWRNSDIR
jgi:hypothetical protein